MAFISTGEGAFGDPAVRRALWMATDTSAIGDTVYEGIADAATSLIPNGGWSYGDEIFKEARTNLTSTEVDIEGAKEVLKSATADLTQPIKIVYPSERSFYADIISEFANAGKELGLTVEPTGVPSAQFGAFFSDAEARAGSDAFITTNYMSIPDPLSYLASIAKTNGSQNYADYSNAEIDALITEAQGTEDADERAKLVVKAEDAIMEQLPWLPVVNPAVLLFMNDKVTGVPASFVYLYYPWAADLGGSGK
jgi:peptide/nickel transport system substrate-binding protein